MSDTMDHVFTYLPRAANDALKELVRIGRYPNRSEAIREAVRHLLRDELPFLTQEDPLNLPSPTLREIEGWVNEEC